MYVLCYPHGTTTVFVRQDNSPVSRRSGPARAATASTPALPPSGRTQPARSGGGNQPAMTHVRRP